MVGNYGSFENLFELKLNNEAGDLPLGRWCIEEADRVKVRLRNEAQVEHFSGQNGVTYTIFHLASWIIA